jgi:cell filamentation protein
MEPTHRQYLFHDPDYKYTDQKTGLLRNIPGIKDEKTLAFFEHTESSSNIKKLEENPIKIITTEDIFHTHYAIFKGIYPFAGQPRTVGIQKTGTKFAEPEEFKDRLKK